MSGIGYVLDLENAESAGPGPNGGREALGRVRTPPIQVVPSDAWLLHQVE